MRSGEFELPLLPLQTVLFPGGLLNLTVFESKYVELVRSCAEQGLPVGAVAALSSDPSPAKRLAGEFETVGTQATLLSTRQAAANQVSLRCQGHRRFQIVSLRQRPDGVWAAVVHPIDDDPTLAPSQPLTGAVRALAQMIATLKSQDKLPFAPPYPFDDAGWVSNRWCELLPISRSAKQRLMELPDPLTRLRLVDAYLRSHGVLPRSQG